MTCRQAAPLLVAWRAWTLAPAHPCRQRARHPAARWRACLEWAPRPATLWQAWRWAGWAARICATAAKARRCRGEIGRTSGREKGCECGLITVGAVQLKKKKKGKKSKRTN